jgi:hypothetical protein
MLTWAKYLTCEYPQHRGMGTWYTAVRENSLPYQYPHYPFWKHHSFTHTLVKPYNCREEILLDEKMCHVLQFCQWKAL